MKYMVILFFICTPVFAQEWSGPYQYNKFPDDVFLAGHEVNGDPIYLGLIFHGSKDFIQDLKKLGSLRLKEPNTTKYEGTWIVAKINSKYRGVKYSFENEEKFSKDYIVFNPTDAQTYKWEGAQDGESPINAIKIWGGNQNRYVCRAKWAGGIFPGVLNTKLKTCTFSFGRREKAVFIYEVLVKL